MAKLLYGYFQCITAALLHIHNYGPARVVVGGVNRSQKGGWGGGGGGGARKIIWESGRTDVTIQNNQHVSLI